MTSAVPISPSSIAAEATFATCTTFLRAPRVASAAGYDVAVLGVPFDLATSNRPGTRFGPAAIRAASAGLAELKAYPGGFDPLEHLKLADLGDVVFDYANSSVIPEKIEKAALEAISTGAFLCSIGGDHFVSYALIKAHAQKHGPLALIQFDAHSDTWPGRKALDEPAEMDHGTMFWRAIKEGLIVPEQSVQVGIRTWVDDAMGVSILDNETVDAHPAAFIGDMIGKVTGGRPAYVTVDIDCLDPAFAPGTGTPVTGGLTPLKLLQILRAISNLDIRGFDLVEVSPPYDHAGITALNAATIVYEQICRLARRKGAAEQGYPRLFPAAPQ